MANPQHGLLPSILDRLVDPDSSGTVARPGYTVEQMARAVQEDLQRLLNTRSDDSDHARQFRLLSRIQGYGLPDLAALSRLGEQDVGNICRIIEEKILLYEPRLKSVQVSPEPNADEDPLKIRLHLQAVLSVDPAPDVVFDTTLDLASGHFTHEKEK